MMSWRSLYCLEDLLHLGRDLVVLGADALLGEDAAGRVERVHGRVDALLRDRPREHRGGVEVGEAGGRGRVGEVVGGDVDGLHRGDRALAGRGDALLQVAHLALEGGLVAHGGGHAAEEGRHLGAGLHEPEDVVDEEQHVLAALVAEVLGHRQAGQGDAQAGAGRLVHLAVHERGLVDDPALLHLQPEVVALAGALAHAGEHRQAAVLLGDVVDQLLDEHRLAHAGAAEEADLAALHVRGEEVDDLDAGLEDLLGRAELVEGRGVRGGWASARPSETSAPSSIVSPSTLKMRPERALADRHRDRARPCRSPWCRGRGRRWCRRPPRGRGRRPGAAAPRRSAARASSPRSISIAL